MADLGLTASAVLAVAGAVALGLGIVIWNASKRLGEPRLRFIAAGFGLMAAKTMLMIWLLAAHVVDHSTLEVMDAVFDASALILIGVPFLLK